MTLSDALQLLAGLVLVGVGIAYYRRRAREEANYGSQGAVILIVIGLIMAIHGFGMLDYRPSGAER